MDERVRTTLTADPTMARLVERHGPVRIEPAEDEYRRLAVSIINQQLSTASASAVRERVFEALGDVTPNAVLAADEATLREAGLSAAKVDYLQSTARSFLEGDYSREGLAHLDNAAVIDRLTDIRGVGEWTAEMYLIFVLGREDVFPLGDLAVRRGIETLYGNGEGLTRPEMREVGERWRPYRSYATRYVWLEYESG